MEKDGNSIINECFFNLLQQLVRGFCTKNIRKNVQVLNKPQMRLLLKNPGGSFLQIQTDILYQKIHKNRCNKY